jgi:hypothetical protein
MVQTRNMAITRQESTTDSEMETTPRNNPIHALTNIAQNDGAEINIIAIQPHNPNEPTLLEITEPDVTFEALSQ